MAHNFVSQISKYGCFPTAVLNSFVFKGLPAPDTAILLQLSNCEELKGTKNKLKVLRSARGVYFRAADPEDILSHAGIITWGNNRYGGHSAFFFRRNGRCYAVNANWRSSSLIERIAVRQFISEMWGSLSKYNHWRLM